MFAVIGLGNPGLKYESTRHNAGFWVLDKLRETLAASETWKVHGGCLCVRTASSDAPLLLIKPQKFMNLSGEAAQPVLQFFKVPPQRVIVVYDELDLPPGRIQVRFGGSAAGHRGVGDLITHLGTQDFFRVRLGIGRIDTAAAKVAGKNWVLSKPGSAEQELLEKAVTLSCEAVETLVHDGLVVAQQKFNRKDS